LVARQHANVRSLTRKRTITGIEDVWIPGHTPQALPRTACCTACHSPWMKRASGLARRDRRVIVGVMSGYGNKPKAPTLVNAMVGRGYWFSTRLQDHRWRVICHTVEQGGVSA